MAKQVTSSAAKLEWEELAREWHLLANQAALAARDISQIDIV